MATVLVTRPLSRVQGLRDCLVALGHDVLCEPLFEVEPLTTPRPSCVPRAAVIALTSVTTLSVLDGTAKDSGRDLLDRPCYCVGERTAAQARASGFTRVRSAGGDGHDLARLVLAQEPAGTTVLHIGGQDVSDEPARTLRAAGVALVHWPVYRARAVTAFSPACQAALAAGEVGFVLLFSARTAQIFTGLVQRAALEPCCRALTAVGLSEAIAAALEPLPMARVVWAAQPDEDSLIACFLSLAH